MNEEEKPAVLNDVYEEKHKENSNVLNMSGLKSFLSKAPSEKTERQDAEEITINPNKDGVPATRMSDGVHEKFSSYVTPIRGQ